MTNHIKFLQDAFKRGYNVETEHVQSIPIRETVQDQTAWGEGIVVEIFEMKSHPKAKFGYGWVYEDDGVKRYATVLGIPPVDSASDAVRAYIASQKRVKQTKRAKRQRKQPRIGKRTTSTKTRRRRRDLTMG